MLISSGEWITNTIESEEAIEQVRSLAEGRRLFVHCKLGMRSAKAVQLLAEHGILATNVTGGIDAWAQEVDPTLPRYWRFNRLSNPLPAWDQHLVRRKHQGQQEQQEHFYAEYE